MHGASRRRNLHSQAREQHLTQLYCIYYYIIWTFLNKISFKVSFLFYKTVELYMWQNVYIEFLTYELPYRKNIQEHENTFKNNNSETT